MESSAGLISVTFSMQSIPSWISANVECRSCKKYIYQGDKMLCSVRECHDAYHRTCAKRKNGSSKVFKCPQHACFICKQKNYLRCVRCNVAFHFKCSPWPTDVFFLTNLPGRSICWRHPLDWRLDEEVASFLH